MAVAIVDYGSGNLRSVAKAFEKVSADIGVGAEIIVTSDPKTVAAADRIVLPGVGAFSDCMRGIASITDMHETLERSVRRGGRPFLGICVGMQLMARRGLEDGCHAGLGWIPGVVEPIVPADPGLKIPHMGWNALICTPQGAAHPMLAGVTEGDHVYFVHSYHMVCDDDTQLLASVSYNGGLAAMIGQDNMVGTQFHPEKSQAVGLRLIANFLRWRP